MHSHKLNFNVLAHMKTSSAHIVLAANQMAQQMSQMHPGAAGAGIFQPGQDPDKVFLSEAENLEVVEHWCILDNVESRLLAYT